MVELCRKRFSFHLLMPMFQRTILSLSLSSHVFDRRCQHMYLLRQNLYSNVKDIFRSHWTPTSKEAPEKTYFQNFTSFKLQLTHFTRWFWLSFSSIYFRKTFFSYALERMGQGFILNGNWYMCVTCADLWKWMDFYYKSFRQPTLFHSLRESHLV